MALGIVVITAKALNVTDRQTALCVASGGKIGQ